MNVNKKICLLLFMFLSIVLYAKSYSTFYLNDFCGAIDENRKIIVEPKYEEIRISNKDYFVCLKVVRGTDFYDNEGTKILEYSINHFTRKYSDYEWLSYIPDSGNKYIKLNCTATTSGTYFFQNVRVAMGINSFSSYVAISSSERGQTYETLYLKPSSKKLTPSGEIIE